MDKKKKIKVYFSIEKELNEKFDKIIEDKLLNKSKLIESLIKIYLENIT